jgi:MFS family permease
MTTEPVRHWYRWLILLIISFVCFGTYYIYDSVTPLKGMLQSSLGLSSADYGLLFSAYSVANVFLFMVLISGLLVDRLGVKRSGILFSLLCGIGSALTAIGASESLPSFLGPLYGWLDGVYPGSWSAELKVMLIGRTIYGVGAEAILVLANKVLARWFLGKELALAYALNLAVLRLGTASALFFQAPIALRFGMVPAIWFATFVMGAGFAAYFLYIAVEARAGGALEKRQSEAGLRSEEDVFRWREAFSFDSSFWLITVLSLCFYSAVFTFQSYAPDLLFHKFGYGPVLAGMYATALVWGTVFFTPIFGWFVDKRGKRATLMVVGASLCVPCYFLLALTPLHPVVPIFFIGMSLSLVPAALWAAIPMMVPASRLGTAFGVVGWIQNVGLMLFPWIAGKIADAHTSVEMVAGEEKMHIDYTMTLVLFAGLASAGLAAAIILKWVDSRRSAGISIEEVIKS